MARLCAVVYQPRTEVRRKVEQKGWKLANWYDNGGTQATLIINEAWAALVFRGTQFSGGPFSERIIDVCSNLMICPTEWAGPGLAHSGYATALSRIRNNSRDLMNDVDRRIPLYVTGHSLGGALATLFASWIVTTEFNIAGLITFGSPKTATKKSFNKLGHHCPIHRFAMPKDIWTSWPWTPWFSHPIEPTILNSNEEFNGPLSQHSITNYMLSFR